MYKLIIVEDESQMNHQLTKILDWENIGFEIVSTFENGADFKIVLPEKYSCVIFKYNK